jgi:hypothetical protein
MAARAAVLWGELSGSMESRSSVSVIRITAERNLVEIVALAKQQGHQCGAQPIEGRSDAAVHLGRDGKHAAVHQGGKRIILSVEFSRRRPRGWFSLVSKVLEGDNAPTMLERSTGSRWRALLQSAFLAFLATTVLAGPTWRGLTVQEALERLGESGLQLIFTDELVPPYLRVEEEPVASDSSGVLKEILAAHGLEVREAVGGRLVVVQAMRKVSQDGRVQGIVQDGRRGRGLSEVLVEVLETGALATTDSEGRFLLQGLAPGTYTLEVRNPGVVPQKLTVQVIAGLTPEVSFEVRSIPPTLEEIDVTTARPRLRAAVLSPIRLDRDTLLSLPQLGGDVFRSLTLLPGTTGNDVSARFSVRGGRVDEVMVRLDGLEVLEPYHLKDFNDALSILTPAVIGQVELFRGQFPAEYGGRMSGVLNLTTAEPTDKRHLRLGTTLLDFRGSGAGVLRDDRANWLVSLRGGSLELPFRLSGEQENPVFWDAFGKLVLNQGSGREVRGNVLFSGDLLDFTEVEGEERETFKTSYRNVYAWLRRQTVSGRDLATSIQVSYSRVERDRQGSENLEGDSIVPSFSLEDKRRLDSLVVAADWLLERTRHTLRWGGEVGTQEVRYDYFNERFFTDPVAVIRSDGRSGARTFVQNLNGEHWSLFAADRMRFGRWTELDLGLRFAENELTDEEHVSPRLELTQGFGNKTKLRFSWGHYFQSQRAYEVQVEDGDTGFEPAELAVHWGVGFEHTFVTAGKGRDLNLRAELYRRTISNPRVRYENLFDPISSVPELEADRVRIAPEDSLSRGLELVLSGSAGPRLGWFLNYTWARITDSIEGREVPRSIDQPHTARLDFDFRAPWNLHLNLALRYHTGWPTTALGARLVEGADGGSVIEPVLGPLYQERLPTYLRMDLRASRVFSFRRGDLELNLGFQNLTSRANVRGYSFSFELGEEGSVVVVRKVKTWGRFLPTVGIHWSF